MAENLNTYGKLGKYYMQLAVGPYNRRKPFDKAEMSIEKFILLPLPTELRDDTGVSYNNQDLQMSGDIINGSMGTGMMSEGLRQSGKLISGGLSSLAGAAAGAMSGGALGSALNSGVKGAVADALPPEQVSSALQQTIGMAPNPNPSVAFQGPVLRELPYSWTFFPTNPDESRRIRAVINYLKMRALPQNTISGAAGILDYPYMCRLNFFPWDSGGKKPYGWSDKSIIRIKHCFMSSVNANYTPSNVPAFFEGTNEPVALSLSITFKEMEYFLSSDYGGGEGASEDLAGSRLEGAVGTLGIDPSTLNATPAQDPPLENTTV